jgi:hypothetical protein
MDFGDRDVINQSTCETATNLFRSTPPLAQSSKFIFGYLIVRTPSQVQFVTRGNHFCFRRSPSGCLRSCQWSLLPSWSTINARLEFWNRPHSNKSCTAAGSQLSTGQSLFPPTPISIGAGALFLVCLALSADKKVLHYLIILPVR